MSPLNGVNAPLPWLDLDKIYEIVAETYDHLASAFPNENFDESLLREPLKTFERLLKRQNKSSILNIGCGLGTEVATLTDRAFNVIGTEISSKIVEKVRK